MCRHRIRREQEQSGLSGSYFDVLVGQSLPSVYDAAPTAEVKVDQESSSVNSDRDGGLPSGASDLPSGCITAALPSGGAPEPAGLVSPDGISLLDLAKGGPLGDLLERAHDTTTASVGLPDDWLSQMSGSGQNNTTNSFSGVIFARAALVGCARCAEPALRRRRQFTFR